MKNKNWQKTLPSSLCMLLQFLLLSSGRISFFITSLNIFKPRYYSKLKLSVAVSQSWSAVLYFLLTLTRLSIMSKKVSCSFSNQS